MLPSHFSPAISSCVRTPAQWGFRMSHCNGFKWVSVLNETDLVSSSEIPSDLPLDPGKLETIF